MNKLAKDLIKLAEDLDAFFTAEEIAKDIDDAGEEFESAVSDKKIQDNFVKNMKTMMNKQNFQLTQKK